MSNQHQVAGNQLALLQNGTAFFPQLCADIDAAQHSIYLETYIFAADATGRMVADALQRAAARGVVVRVLLDGFGSAEVPQHWGEVVFVTGINIINDIPEYRDFSISRLDYAVRVQGTVAGEIHAAMRHLWGVVSWASFRRRGKEIRRFIPDRSERVDTPEIVFLVRDNLRHRRDIERAYLEAIYGAQREIIIANAYFLPGRVFLRALIQAAQRGTRVVLLLQGRVEYRLQHYATHALYDQLLAAGVEIHEYQASYLHAKVAVVDGQWATVGSSNIDPYSLLLAREANLVIQDGGFAGELRASLLAAIGSDAIRIGDEYCGNRNFFGRLIARLSYGPVRA